MSFMKDGFIVSKKHNKKYGGLYFSQLNQINDEIQSLILNYEIAVDLLVNMSDPDVLDVFSRLNSYSITLNDQEKINANHFSEFKSLADSTAHRNNNFWIKNKIISEQKVLRMFDVQMSADLLIGMIEGVRSKKQIKKQYAIYEKEFHSDIDDLENKFNSTIDLISKIFNNNLSKREFKRSHVFFSIFISIYHLNYGGSNINRPLGPVQEQDIAKISQKLEHVDFIFKTEEKQNLTDDDNQFLEDCRRATTDTAVRIRRSEYLIDIMS